MPGVKPGPLGWHCSAGIRQCAHFDSSSSSGGAKPYNCDSCGETFRALVEFVNCYSCSETFRAIVEFVVKSYVSDN